MHYFRNSYREVLPRFGRVEFNRMGLFFLSLSQKPRENI